MIRNVSMADHPYRPPWGDPIASVATVNATITTSGAGNAEVNLGMKIIIPSNRVDHECNRTGGYRDHCSSAAHDGDSDGHRERCLKPHPRVHASENRKRDRFGIKARATASPARSSIQRRRGERNAARTLWSISGAAAIGVRGGVTKRGSLLIGGRWSRNIASLSDRTLTIRSGDAALCDKSRDVMG